MQFTYFRGRYWLVEITKLLSKTCFAATSQLEMLSPVFDGQHELTLRNRISCPQLAAVH
jgi:hypothetical protein